ncbi:hypothetical protein BGX31_005970, partial [Mortierella sp. GBA43]
MSKTVPLTLDIVQAHCNRYWILQELNEDAEPPNEPYNPIPPVFSITAPQLDNASHAFKMRRKRERRLDVPFKEALRSVSASSFASAGTMEEIDEVQV